jgi:uncharacterized protein YhhL (DUF1145 family)
MINLAEKYTERHTYSHWTLRKGIGWIGILLPFVLIFGSFFIFQGDHVERSISYYYHTSMRDVFVGSLCAVALLMLFYSGNNKVDDWTGNFAAICAILVAWFPCTQTDEGNWVNTVHLTSAILFFGTLALNSIWLFIRNEKNIIQTSKTRNRRIIYLISGITILASLIAVILYYKLFSDKNPESTFIFWGETLGLFAFGVSWITSGQFILRDKS